MLYREQGPEGLSMRQLASRLDYAPATLYKYFRNKAELIIMVRDRFFERHVETMRHIMASEEDPLRRLARGCTAYIDEALAEPELYTIAFGSREEEADPVKMEESCGGEAFRLLQDRLAELMKAGLIAPCDTEKMAFCIWASLHGFASLLILNPKFTMGDDRSKIDSHVEFVIGGLKRADQL